MAYVVTGATGHIGNNLVKRLIGLNQKVRILTRRVDESIDNLQAEYKIGDVFNREFLLENINSEDVVIHLAPTARGPACWCTRGSRPRRTPGPSARWFPCARTSSSSR